MVTYRHQINNQILKYINSENIIIDSVRNNDYLELLEENLKKKKYIYILQIRIIDYKIKDEIINLVSELKIPFNKIILLVDDVYLDHTNLNNFSTYFYYNNEFNNDDFRYYILNYVYKNRDVLDKLYHYDIPNIMNNITFNAKN